MNNEFVRVRFAKILRARAMMGAKCNALDEMLGDAMSELFGWEFSEIDDAIADLCVVPEEETDFESIGVDTSDMLESQIEYGYCRDWILNEIFEAEEQLDASKDSRDVDLKPFLEIVDKMNGIEVK